MKPTPDLSPAAKFSRELRFQICRWMSEGGLSVAEIVGVLEIHQHELMTRQFFEFQKQIDKLPPPPPG